MQAIASITVVMALVGISEVIAVKSKGHISTLFSAAFLLMIGFWIGLPKDIFISSGMLSLLDMLRSEDTLKTT